MTMMRLLALEEALDEIGWKFVGNHKDKFIVHMNSIEWTIKYRNTKLEIDIFIYLTDGLHGITKDLSDLFYVKIQQTGEKFYFEKINSSEWALFVKNIKMALSNIASEYSRKK